MTLLALFAYAVIADFLQSKLLFNLSCDSLRLEMIPSIVDGFAHRRIDPVPDDMRMPAAVLEMLNHGALAVSQIHLLFPANQTRDRIALV